MWKMIFCHDEMFKMDCEMKENYKIYKIFHFFQSMYSL